MAEIGERRGKPTVSCFVELVREMEDPGALSISLTDESALTTFMKAEIQCFGFDGILCWGLNIHEHMEFIHGYLVFIVEIKRYCGS